MGRVNVYMAVDAECRGQAISIGGASRNNYINSRVLFDVEGATKRLNVECRALGQGLTARDRQQYGDDRIACAEIDVRNMDGPKSRIILSGWAGFPNILLSDGSVPGSHSLAEICDFVTGALEALGMDSSVPLGIALDCLKEMAGEQ